MTTTTRSLGYRQFMWGLSNGVFVLAIAGAVWFSMAASVAESVPSWTWILTELAILAGVVLVAWGAVRVRRAADGFSLRDLKDASAAARARAHRIQIGFLWVSLLEGALVGLSFFLCDHFHRDDLRWAGLALAVSLHFLPLARLVRVRPYYWTAVAGSLLSLAALVVPHAALSATMRTSAVGLGMGTVVWMTAAYVTLRADRVGRVWDDAGEPA
jgi:hypothetical protein